MTDPSEIEALRLEVKRLNEQRFFRDTESTRRFLFFQFLRGLAFGLGTVVGASLLVSVVAFTLSQIDFIPIIGDWASEIARQIQIEDQ
ncbi:MAG: DUF5665 domain-containing protein [Pseudomonadota bacterium]